MANIVYILMAITGDSIGSRDVKHNFCSGGGEEERRVDTTDHTENGITKYNLPPSIK